MEKKRFSFGQMYFLTLTGLASIYFLGLATWMVISAFLRARQYDAPVSYFLFDPLFVVLWITVALGGLACLAITIAVYRSKD